MTTVDERIEKSSQKVELLKKYKKGLMQKIFSQEIRFKDEAGKAFPDWEEKTLGELTLSIRNGLSIDQNNQGEGFKVTRIETISNNSINLDKVGYISTEQNVQDYKLIQGDILFSNINSPAQIGTVVYVGKDYDIYHGMNLLNIRINSQNEEKIVFYILMMLHLQLICHFLNWFLLW